MKTKKREESKVASGEKCSGYLARGALVWGPLYTAGVSGMAYAVGPSVTGDGFVYSDVLLNSLLVCPSLGAAGGYIRWRLIKPRAGGGGKIAEDRTLTHRFKSRRAAHRKAA